MIDASYFAASYTAFWSEYTPACEHFIRHLNLRGAKKYTQPIFSYDKINRPQFIAEYAFSMFAEKVKSGGTDKALRDRAYADTASRMLAFGDKSTLRRRLSRAESYELFEIYDKIMVFFHYKTQGILVRPSFPGCGFIDQSEGDIVHGDTLYEIKTVDRNFRGSDIRQLITYSALNFASKKLKFERIGLINPRRGSYCSYELAEVCSEISGIPGMGLLEVIVSTIAGGESSR